LVLDVVDVAIPFVGGLGEAADAVNLSRKAAKAVDNAHDASKIADGVEAFVDTTSVAKKGWKVGDDIRNLTKAGKDPSWTALRQRYWKNEAYYHPERYPNDLKRLKKGRAPIGEDGFPMELHHPNGRDGNNYYLFEPMTRTKHRYEHYGR
jgi:hypothetical protein